MNAPSLATLSIRDLPLLSRAAGSGLSTKRMFVPDTDPTPLAEYGKEVVFEKATDLFSFFASDLFHRTKWVYRGQHNADWGLRPSLERFASSAIGRFSLSDITVFDRRALPENVHSQKRSSLIATNTAFSDWGNILFNTTIATAIVHRLVENSEIPLLGGDSLRKAVNTSTSPVE